MMSEISIDRDYLIMKPGESVKLSVTGVSEAWGSFLIWEAEDTDGDNTGIISVSEDTTQLLNSPQRLLR